MVVPLSRFRIASFMISKGLATGEAELFLNSLVGGHMGEHQLGQFIGFVDHDLFVAPVFHPAQPFLPNSNQPKKYWQDMCDSNPGRPAGSRANDNWIVSKPCS